MVVGGSWWLTKLGKKQCFKAKSYYCGLRILKSPPYEPQSQKSVHTTAKVRSFSNFKINLEYVSIELLTLAVVWPLFTNSEKWPYNCQGLQFCDKIFTTQKSGHTTATVSSFGSQLRKPAIQLPPLAVLAQSKSWRWDKSQKSAHKTAKVCSCMVTMRDISEKCPYNCQGLQL